jgi:hypothetical protein
MKKFALIAFSMLALAVSSQAQAFEGMGYDTQVNEVVGRLGVGGNHVEVGVGFGFNDNENLNSDAKTQMSVSGRYLLALHQWEKLTGYLHLGAYFRDDNDNGGSPNFGAGHPLASSLAFLAAYQPELVLLNHLAVSTTFGLAVAVIPDVQIHLAGEPVSIVSGLSFRILL